MATAAVYGCNRHLSRFLLDLSMAGARKSPRDFPEFPFFGAIPIHNCQMHMLCITMENYDHVSDGSDIEVDEPYEELEDPGTAPDPLDQAQAQTGAAVLPSDDSSDEDLEVCIF